MRGERKTSSLVSRPRSSPPFHMPDRRQHRVRIPKTSGCLIGKPSRFSAPLRPTSAGCSTTATTRLGVEAGRRPLRLCRGSGRPSAAAAVPTPSRAAGSRQLGDEQLSGATLWVDGYNVLTTSRRL